MATPARDFLNELADAITWLEPTALVLAQRKSNAANGCNWSAATTPTSAVTQDAFQEVISKWRATHLELDWSHIAFDGDRRLLVLWIYPPGTEADGFLISGSQLEGLPASKPPS